MRLNSKTILIVSFLASLAAFLIAAGTLKGLHKENEKPVPQVRNAAPAIFIPEGYRVSTIPISASGNVLEFLKPGTRVDVLFTDPAKAFETKTILKNVQIMKVSPAPKESGGDSKAAAFISLAVPPHASETLAYAVQKGKIDLSIRSTAERGKKEEYMHLDELLGLKKTFAAPILGRSEIEIIKGTKRSTVRL